MTEELSAERLATIARQLAATDGKPEQLGGVPELVESLLEGVNRLSARASHDELPALQYRLPEWE